MPILLISHNLPQIHARDRVVVLFQGHVVADLRRPSAPWRRSSAGSPGRPWDATPAVRRAESPEAGTRPWRLSSRPPSPPGDGVQRRAEGEPTERSAWLAAVDRFGDFWMLGVFVIMVLVFGFLSPSHDLFTRASWLNISQYAVEFLLLAVGQTFVIITGGIDLSDGAVLGFTGMVSGVVMQNLLDAHTNSHAHDRRRFRDRPRRWAPSSALSTATSSPGSSCPPSSSPWAASPPSERGQPR